MSESFIDMIDEGVNNQECFRPLIEDMVWSHSRISCFKECPYRWFMKYIHIPKEIDEPRFYSSYGRFMHKLIELYYKGRITREQMKIKFLTEFTDKVSGDRPSGKIVSDYIQKGLTFIESFEPIPYHILEVEKRLEFKIEDKNFVGVIDILAEKDGELYIIDNKSRELRPRSKRKKPTRYDEELDEMLEQLYIYSAAVKQIYGKYPKSLCFNCFKSGVFIEEPFIEEVYKSVIDSTLKTISVIEGAEMYDFRPSIEYFKCKYLCGLSKSCEYYELT